MTTKPTLMQFGPMQDCGCPFEDWQYHGIEMYMHFEPDGSVDVYSDAGDWDRAGKFASREAAFAWIDSLPDG